MPSWSARTSGSRLLPIFEDRQMLGAENFCFAEFNYSTAHAFIRLGAIGRTGFSLLLLNFSALRAKPDRLKPVLL